MRILGIESSCDELACAVLEPDGKTLLSNVVHSQVDLHAKFGGVVPELASRDHVRRLGPVLRLALDEADVTMSSIDGLAVTCGPGLIGSLLCGVEFAKGLALSTGRPLIGINHLEGHLAAAFLETETPAPPYLALLVSGGHTNIVHVEALGGRYTHVGATRDDAAGEAFDKTAKVLGLGYPGGVAVDRLASSGDARRFGFPQPMPGKLNFDFSFSGLKTAAIRTYRAHAPLDPQGLADFCASFQAAIVENLLKKTFRAAKHLGLDQIALAGGVAANSELRRRADERGRREGIRVFLPSRAYCTDNAAMIAKAGQVRLLRGERSDLDLGARAHWPLFEGLK